MKYLFEGSELSCDVPHDILDQLAGIAISYKILSKDRLTKAAKEQRSFFDGVLYGLILGEVMRTDERETVRAFFLGE